MTKLSTVSYAVMAMAVALASAGAASAQTGEAATGPEADKAAIDAPLVEPRYTVPRLAIGQPDLQGVWSNASNTTMRRPGKVKNRVMTDEEAAIWDGEPPDTETPGVVDSTRATLAPLPKPRPRRGADEEVTKGDGKPVGAQ